MFRRKTELSAGNALMCVLIAMAIGVSVSACGQATENIETAGENAMVLPDDQSEEIYDPSVTDEAVAQLAAKFTTPTHAASEQAQILTNYAHLDPNRLVATALLQKAVLYYHANKAKLANDNVLSIIDFSLSSTKKRFFFIDMTTGQTWATTVAHGKGSDSNHDSFAESFSNVPGSRASSVGPYLAAETYQGSNGYSLRLDGLASTNSKARARAIVVHGASYVRDAAVIQGRSWGCPAVPTALRTKIIDLIKGGSLLYAGESKNLVVTPAPSPSPSPTPVATATPIPRPSPTPTPSTGNFTALWIGKHPDAINWTGYVHEAVKAYGAALLAGPSDVATFCPKYASLSTTDKLNFWAQLVAAMTKYESNFNPTTRYTETSMGIDPVTGKQVVSEGLLQLSYQDERNYSSVAPAGVCDFDYAADSKLAINDIRRTIFDPKTNLTCGVFILNRLAVKKGIIAVDSGAYWSVLRPSGTRLASIRSLTKATSFCQ